MKYSFTRLFLISFLLTSLFYVPQAFSQENWTESEQIKQLFQQANIDGTFVLYDVKANSFVGYNKTRAEKRFIPASTFKIANTLIGLEEKAIKNVDEIIPYGGKKQPVASWEKDMSLRDAIKISNIPIYQELARRIGLKNMQKNLTALNYGNAQIGTTVDTFWLKGPLQISALEQCYFLANLAGKKLPFSLKTQEAACEILITEQSNTWSLFSKTGTVSVENPQIGWWIGWVEKNNDIYAFAININIVNPEDASKRITLGRACLEALKIL